MLLLFLCISWATILVELQERQAELRAAEELRLSEQRQKAKAEKAELKAKKVAEQKDWHGKTN